MINQFTKLIESVNKDSSYINKRQSIKEAEENFEKEFSINEYNSNFASPYFLPSKILSLGAYKYSKKDNYYGEYADNTHIDRAELIPTKQWFNDYLLTSEGFITDKSGKYSIMWRDSLRRLYSDYDKIKESGTTKEINARKQSILELGWNPEVDFTNENRIKANNKLNSYIESRYENRSIIDLTDIYVSDSVITEGVKDKDNILFPVYIMLSYTFTAFGKIIKAATHGIYTHSALALDSSLQHLYSFNADNGINSKGGFSLENIKTYKNENGKSSIALYCVFVTKDELLKLKMELDNFIATVKATSYSYITALGTFLNKQIELKNSMICSQFVDFILKSINVDITNKASSLVTPNDFYIAAKNSPKKIYKVYEGLISDYNSSKVDKLITKLQNKVSSIKESNEIITESQFLSILNEAKDIDTLLYLNENTSALNEDKDLYNLYNKYIKENLDIQPITEIKEFPIGFDNAGNLFIKKKKHINFETEYANSHKLLVLYSKDKNKESNINGIMYELAKLWYMNILLEDKIYNQKSSEEEIKSYHKARAKIINDFKKYLKELQETNKNFNFTEYYESTPFSSDTITVSKSTIHYSGETLKDILKILLK